MTNFSKRHYEAIADLLNGLYLDLKNDGETLNHVESEMTTMFKMDNSKFRASTFAQRVYVGLEEVDERRAFINAEKRFATKEQADRESEEFEISQAAVRRGEAMMDARFDGD